MRKTTSREIGFSLVETLIVVSIIMIVTATALMTSSGSFASYKANAAMDVAMGQLRVARQLGISQRRAVAVTITAIPPSVSYQVKARFGVAGDVDGPVVTQPLPTQTAFVEEPGVPDTPMGFGTCTGNAVCIGGACTPTSMYFTSTGQFSSDQNGVFPCNGTLFIGIPGQTSTARAITIMGATGRVRPYKYVGPISGVPTWME